ncbi:response regulator transcription factor [Acrocarpospora macrocephala]|uniref:DNA-binding response regulator n=1 Tax=Acrocarpospora macrocephala TaxID=150177 RepID=A0A5M3WFR0_9ACTN|nr:response regulator transcription factor [Acrocarpospora macrocephala]GES07907.1 DNA-binding response regulator [Acrocarpospora macrocephala]
MTVRVVVADDETLLRAGLCGIIGTAPDLTVVGEAANGLEAVRLVRTRAPHVVLMDIRMPDLDGLEATRLITASSDAKVVILTTFDLDEYVYVALRGGASGFLVKDTPAQDLLTAIRVVAAGQALLSPSVTRRLITKFAQRDHSALPHDITERERQVLTLIAEGLTNSEIAERLHIGPGTAKTHVRHLLAKLDARDRVHLVIIAYRSGLVPLS